MVRASRIAYLVLAWAFLIGVVAQVFFIGMVVFGQGSFRELHINLGYMLHFWPLLILLAAYLARAGKVHWRWALALALVTLVVPLLPMFRSSAPVIAALHPVGSLAVFALAVVVAYNAWQAYRLGTEPAPAA